jgi:hypothetical protein
VLRRGVESGTLHAALRGLVFRESSPDELRARVLRNQQRDALIDSDHSGVMPARQGVERVHTPPLTSQRFHRWILGVCRSFKGRTILKSRKSGKRDSRCCPQIGSPLPFPLLRSALHPFLRHTRLWALLYLRLLSRADSLCGRP